MGIVQRQTLRGTSWSYLGAILGFVNIGLLSPRVFVAGEIGVIQLLISFAAILAQFSSLGFTNVFNRLFPYFRDADKKHNGFLALALTISLAGFVMALVFLKFYTPYFERANLESSPLVSEYSFYLPVLLLISLLFNLLDNYYKVLYNAVIGTFLKEFILRVVNLVLIFCFWVGIFDFNEYVFFFIIGQSIPLIFIVISLFMKGELHFELNLKFITPELKKQILYLSLFGFLTGFSTYILTMLDKLFINNYLGESQVGIYAITSYFPVLILMPSKAIAKISVPFLAESWKNENMALIKDIYLRSSINQFAIGLLIFIGLIVNLDNIMRILPADYVAGTYVIIFLGFGNLINVSSGISGTIIGTSSLYRYQTWLMIVLIVVFVAASMILIPLFGISGAALATMISNIVFNTLGVLLIGKSYALWPYTQAHLKMTAVSLIALAVGLVLPQMMLLPDILIRSLLVTLVFTLGLYLGKMSGDLNRLIDSIIEFVVNRLY